MWGSGSENCALGSLCIHLKAPWELSSLPCAFKDMLCNLRSVCPAICSRTLHKLAHEVVSDHLLLGAHGFAIHPALVLWATLPSAVYDVNFYLAANNMSSILGGICGQLAINRDEQLP